MISEPPASSRSPLAAAAVFIVPAAFGALVLAVAIGGAVGWTPFWPTDAATLSEAIALRDLATARALFEAGADPNATYAVRADLVKSQAVAITPLEAAVTTREDWVFAFVLDHGASMDEASRARVYCLARQENADRIAEMIVPPDAVPPSCEGVPLPW